MRLVGGGVGQWGKGGFLVFVLLVFISSALGNENSSFYDG
jgi:hypothetical protein